MNDLQIFNSKEFGNVRAVIVNDLPWFVGKRCLRSVWRHKLQKKSFKH